MLKLMFSIFIVAYSSLSFSAISHGGKDNAPLGPIGHMLHGSLPGLIYSYVDFYFNSSSGANFNRFRGHSNIVGFGGNQLNLFKDFQGGVFFYHIDTSNMTYISISPNSPSLYNSKNRNDTIFAHLTKPLKHGFSVDGGFGYGSNHSTLNGTIYASGLTPFYSNASYSFNNWFANATLFYQRQMKSFVVSAFVQGLYTQSDVNGYTQQFSANFSPSTVAPLTTKITYILEDVTVNYKSNNPFSPYLSAGLIQVADYSQSRPSLAGTVNGSLPQLALNQSGYRLGGGLGYNHKNAAVRVDYRYYEAGSQFHSSQVTLNLTYLLD